jgi:hypothetical protein
MKQSGPATSHPATTPPVILELEPTTTKTKPETSPPAITVPDSTVLESHLICDPVTYDPAVFDLVNYNFEANDPD